MPDNKLPTILVINTSDDFLDIMRLFLNAEGYVTIPITITDIKVGNIDIVEVIKNNDPKVIVYDIAFPYKENWKQFHNIAGLDVYKGRKFILTTPNLDALENQVGEQISAYEIIDKETDLQKIVIQVNKVWATLNAKDAEKT